MTNCSCEDCLNYLYDEQWDAYYCAKYVDEDDYARMLYGGKRRCPFFEGNDEYKIVHKQL